MSDAAVRPGISGNTSGRSWRGAISQVVVHNNELAGKAAGGAALSSTMPSIPHLGSKWHDVLNAVLPAKDVRRFSKWQVAFANKTAAALFQWVEAGAYTRSLFSST
jgi:hypothetical protein